MMPRILVAAVVAGYASAFTARRPVGAVSLHHASLVRKPIDTRSPANPQCFRSTCTLLVMADTSEDSKKSSLDLPMISSCSMIRQDTIHNTGDAAMNRGRRKFLLQSAVMFLPVVGLAEDTVEVSDIVKEEKEPVAEPAKEDNAGQAKDEAVENVGQAKDERIQVADLVKEEKELVAELVKEEKEEDKAIEDTQRLITELEEQIKDEANDSKPDEQKLQINKNLIDTLEKEEERIESEAKGIIAKIETLEKETEGQDASPAVPDTPTTQEFLNKLKDRVEEKEDLIARLKRESEKDIDPKTGKFKAMTNKEFKARAPSDFDFVAYLKESLSNTEEFERDLEAFEGLLESKFGPVIEGIGNAAKEVKEVIKE